MTLDVQTSLCLLPLAEGVHNCRLIWQSPSVQCRWSQTIAAMMSEAQALKRVCWTGATLLGWHQTQGAGAQRASGQTKDTSHLSTPPSSEGFLTPFCPQSDLFPMSGGVPWLLPGCLQLNSRSWKSMNLCYCENMLCLRACLKFKSLLPSNRTHGMLEVDWHEIQSLKVTPESRLLDPSI